MSTPETKMHRLAGAKMHQGWWQKAPELVELADADRFVIDHNATLTPLILRCEPRGTAVRVTGLRLDATKGEHEAARRLAPVSAKREHTRHIEPGHDPSAP
jgi:hypothetical protein